KRAALLWEEDNTQKFEEEDMSKTVERVHDGGMKREEGSEAEYEYEDDVPRELLDGISVEDVRRFLAVTDEFDELEWCSERRDSATAVDREVGNARQRRQWTYDSL
ncbi:hypothetical protein HDU98_011381, partial [Podochytrium sp. JEL0797]